MRLSVGLLILALSGLCTRVSGQDTEGIERVPLRVTAAGPEGTVIVDRGERDRMAVGDLVLLTPRGGGTLRGTVIQIDERSGIVALHDRTVIPPAGTSGEVLIPSARFQVQERVEETGPERQETTPAHPPWENRDVPWQEGMPLLSQVRPVRPEDRRSEIRGRIYTIGNVIQTKEDSFKNSFGRVGTDLLFQNPFGAGGNLRFDGEFNYKTEVNDESGLDLLLYNLSYSQGGTRFSDSRWEVGRFLQHGMPELGVLDGFEYSHRTQGGNLLGGSIGFMPRPTDDFDSFADFQIAAYYLWAVDPRQELSIGGGVQKTLHNGESDRDLLVAKFRYLPPDGLYLNGTFWVDFYTSDDDVKGSGPELTEVVASLGNRSVDGSGFDLSYRHQMFPEIDRNEFIPILDADLADNYYDRLTLSGWGWLADNQRLHGHVGGWVDEEEAGGFGDLGMEIQDVFLNRDRLDVTLFGNRAEYSSGGGVRISYGRYTENGRWDLFYEITDNHQFDFPNDADDILQHRFRVSRSIYTDSGWNLSLDAGATLWDREWSWNLGFYIEKNF